MRLKNSSNGPIVPLADSSRKANSILALDGLTKAILVRTKKESDYQLCVMSKWYEL